MRVLGINAVFHDPAAALVVDGVTVAAAEEERFSRRKHGKDLWVETPVLTDLGWKTMGTLQPGDLVHTLDGSLTLILAASEVFHDQRCYEVEFADGQTLIAGEHHEWVVYNKRGDRLRVTTRELRGGYAVARADRREFRYGVRMDRALERPVADLPIDPYILGYWLGDGHSDDARFSTHLNDATSLLEAAVSAGYVVGEPAASRRSTVTLRISTGRISKGSRESLARSLRELGVLDNKHVPDEYLFASADQRLALLQGLMDSGGGVVGRATSPQVEFSTTNESLARAVLFLARSLGWKATLSEGTAAYRDKKTGPKFRVLWTAYADHPPFRLARKRTQLRAAPYSPARSCMNKIVGVRRAPTVPTRCIRVADESGQFLAGEGLIPTHNSPVPFSTWEVPEKAAAWCLQKAGLSPGDLDAVAYSYDPDLAPRGNPGDGIAADDWEGLRTLYARRAPLFLRAALPGLDPGLVRFVPHHVAHAASAYLAAPYPSSSVLVLDGRGERASYLAGRAEGGELAVLAVQELPHSLGLMYEELTEHLGFKRSSDEYKVMAMASYGGPSFLPELRELVRATDDGGFVAEKIKWSAFARRLRSGDEWGPEHADLACSVQTRLEEVLLDLIRWLHERTDDRVLTMAGGVALNCVANSRLAEQGPFDRIWVQPASGDSGTALGAAMYVARELGDDVRPMPTAALGREWSDEELEGWLKRANVAHERPRDIAEAVAEILAADGVVAWFQGRSEYGPRALGHRSLLAHPGRPENLERMNDIKGREQFRPIAPMVLAERAPEIFDGPLPSPYMLFTHRVREDWKGHIPAVVHVDGTARIQTVDRREEPLVARMLEAFERRTGLPVVVNTSLNTAGRPMVDDPRDALECFGSAPIDVLALGPYLVRRSAFIRRSSA